VTVTPEIIAQTREHFAEIYRRCIAAAKSGEDRVNDLGAYIAFHEAAIDSSLAGEGDSSFAFRQYAHYLATGVCVPFMAP